MCVHGCVCMGVCARVCVHGCVCTGVCAWVCVHGCVWVCMSAHVPVYVYVCWFVGLQNKLAPGFSIIIPERSRQV